MIGREREREKDSQRERHTHRERERERERRRTQSPDDVPLGIVRPVATATTLSATKSLFQSITAVRTFGLREPT